MRTKLLESKCRELITILFALLIYGQVDNENISVQNKQSSATSSIEKKRFSDDKANFESGLFFSNDCKVKEQHYNSNAISAVLFVELLHYIDLQLTFSLCGQMSGCNRLTYVLTGWGWGGGGLHRMPRE